MAKLWSAMWFHKNCFYMKFLQRFFVFLPPLPPEMSVWICQIEILTISFNIYIIGYKLYIIICILLTYIVYTYNIYTIYVYIYSEFACIRTQSCLTLCNPMHCTLPGSSVHGILKARILEWDAISSSRESSQPRDQTRVSCNSCIGSECFYYWATWESPYTYNIFFFFLW